MLQQTHPTGRYIRSSNIVSREIAGETLLVPICQNVADLSSLYVLNETGAFLWSIFEQPRSLEDAGRALSAAFEVSVEEACQDVLLYAQQLMGSKLLVPAGEGG